MSIDKFDIGPRLSIYQGYPIRKIEAAATLSLLFIVCGVPFLIGLYRTLYGYAQFGSVAAVSWGFPWFIFSFIFFLIISVYAIYRLSIARVSITLHKHGIIIQKMLRKNQTIRWEDISELYVIQLTSRSKNKSIDTKAVIATKDNSRFSLKDSMIDNLLELLTQIKASVYVHLYPKIRDRFRAGETISFGPLIIHPRHIKIIRGVFIPRSSHVPFTDINRITVKSGHLLIKYLNNQDIRISAGKVPNLEILLDLIRSKTKV